MSFSHPKDFLLWACTSLLQKEEKPRKMVNKSLKLEKFEIVQQAITLLTLEEKRQTHKYLSMVYLQNSCNPSYPKFIEWQQKMDAIDTLDLPLTKRLHSYFGNKDSFDQHLLSLLMLIRKPHPFINITIFQ
ncbi:hypothetical protein [Marinilabilia rubra]|uniref:Uncharacterized protein n=1 Tax=Marinilabilia rubra TaxID=2162893 RepID=A0A2U2B7J1_9BACT|nr:hypothetical protein [Marinilabilia rubra]PWD99016.1 hypothetical protein DDZ16_12180 [Marinilabilia rubra]